MSLTLDFKKLSYIFYSIGLLLIVSLLFAIAGNNSLVASIGSFLFKSFSFPAFYLPFFLIFYGYFTYRKKMNYERLIVLTLSVIPFLTISLLFRLMLSPEGSVITQSAIEVLGKNRSIVLLLLLFPFEVFLLYFIPRFFTFQEDPDSEEVVNFEDEIPENNIEQEDELDEEDAFSKYAFRFPDPGEEDLNKEFKEKESIDEIFSSILSGGESILPPSHPVAIEPIVENDPYEELQSPFVKKDPAIAVLSGDKKIQDEDIPEELLRHGDYTYHSPKAVVAEEEEAAEKIDEIMAELESVLLENSEVLVESELISGKSLEKVDNPVPCSYKKNEPDIIKDISPVVNKESDPVSEAVESLVVEDRFEELDEYRDTISSKLAPVEGYEGGVLQEEQPKLPIKKRAPYSIPVEGVLAQYPDNRYSEIDDDTRKSARILEVTLEEFKISAKVTGIKKGPVITMFELLPAPGVKISKITNLADNIALRLAASRVRIVAPIPGKHAVGIEVPNKKRAIVSFSEMVQASEMKDRDIAVPIVLGKDIRGGTQVIDLTRTPHLLIAGATGSGKSVCVNSLICSILYERSQNDVKMILIDPKIVELKLYNDIPHLLTPVITDPKKAIQAIQWCLYEMERRYSLLDALGVREIRSYNKRIKERQIATTELPYLILVIDEFADLMATSGKELEAMIARLAAMSRAVGIHLVLATQRPSADVITGLIKANFPSRVAFMVASMMDSRIIIDSAGAEKLLGKGDMLFTSAWDPFPSRVQGAFMSEEEVERVVAYVKTLGEPEYIDDEIFFDEEEEDQPSLVGGSTDPLFNKALEIVASAGKASASYLQRRLKIGYNRAARLVEQMEEMGIVGPQNGSKPREVIHMPDTSTH